MTLQDLPPTLTVEQAGELLGVSRRSAYRAASTGELPTIKLGRRLVVPTARILELLGLSEDRLAASAQSAIR
jgi:excisionase family DNA binding protein